MAARYFNWKLAIVLVVGVAVFAGAAFALRQWQRNARAEDALPRAEEAYAQQDWDEAANQFGRYLGVHGDDQAVLLKYADAQLNRRPVTGPHIQQAVAAYRAVLRLDRNNAEAANRLTDLYISMGTPGEAELIAKGYLENHEDPNLSRMLGIALARQRKYREAETTLSEVVRDDPARVRVYEILGVLAQSRPEDFNRPAAEWFDEMVSQNPQSADAYLARARFRLGTGEAEEGLADLDVAQKMEPADPEVRLQLAELLIRVGELDTARDHLVALKAQIPENVMLWQTWAALALRSGTAEEMAEVATSGLEKLAPQPWDFMALATELLIRAGQPDEAQTYIQQMRDRDLGLPRVAFLEGLLASVQGKSQEAAEHWQEAIEQGYTAHRFPLQRDMPVRLMLASVLTQLGDIQSATGQLQALTAENPTDARGHLALAELRSRTGDWAAVRQEAREVLRLAPGHKQAALLELQARTALLGAAGASGDGNAATWANIEKDLAALTEEGDANTVEIGLLRVQVAMRQSKMAEAATLLNQLKSEHPADLRLILLEGQLLAADEKVPEAIELMRGTIEQFPQALEPVRRLVLMLNQQEDREQCESVVRNAMERMDQPQARQVLGLFLADLYRLWAQEEKLQQWLKELQEKFPDDIQIKRRLLAQPTVLTDAQRAQELVDEIKTLEGEAGWQWRLEQARVWIVSGDFNDVYAETTRLLRENLLSNPDDQTSRLLLAAAHEKAGRQEQALSVYREALSRSPDNVLIIAQTAAALQRAGTREGAQEAQRILDDAARRDLKHPDLDALESYGQRFEAQDHWRAGELDLASGIFQQLVNKDPNDVSAGLQLALLLMQQEKFEEAKVLLREIESKAPESGAVTTAKVRLEVLRGNHEEAIRLCSETIDRFGTASAYLLRAQTYVALQANDEATADFNRAIEMDPNSLGLWVERAAFFRSLGRTDEALADIQQALSRAPESLPIQKLAMEMYFTSQSPQLREEARSMLDGALQAHPDDIALQMLKIRLLLSERTKAAVQQAESMLREVTNAQPTLAEAWHLLGNLELQRGQAGRALDTAVRGLAHSEQDRQLLLLKAEAEAARSPALAVPTLRQLADSNPNDVTVEMRLAYCLYRSGKKSEGRALLDERMRAEPNNPAPLITTAQLLAIDKDWAQLRERVTQWLEKNPEDVNTRMNVAGLLVARAAGAPEAVTIAEALLSEVLERSPESMAALGLLAVLKQTTGQEEESVALNRKILEIDPNNVVAANNLAWILCEEKQQYQEALALADRGLQIAPDYVDLIDTRGVIHYRLGAADGAHYEKAVADFQRCLELYLPNAPSLAATRFHLARAYEKTGRTTEAVREVTAAMNQHEDVGGLSPDDLAAAGQLLDRLQRAN